MRPNDNRLVHHQPNEYGGANPAPIGNNHMLEISNTTERFDTNVSFKQLHIKDEIILALNELHIYNPSIIQSTILPYLLGENPRNIVAQAQTGTGKTIAYIIAALQVVDVKQNFTQVLIITPTYELSKQVHVSVLKLGAHCEGLAVELAVRENQPAHFPNRAHIVIGCLGTLMRWLHDPNWLDISKCYLTVLDEADKMLPNKLQYEQFNQIQSKIDVANFFIFCSATFSIEVVELTVGLLFNPVIILLRADELALKNITQFSNLAINDEQKIKLILEIYRNVVVSKTIIFCNTRELTNLLSLNLIKASIPTLTISGDMPLESRTRSIESFRISGEYRVLVTTNICSRGIDIRSINLVINFNLPLNYDNSPDYETYYHRIGRGGRMGDKGASISLYSNDMEKSKLNMIANYHSHPIIDIDLSTPAGIASLTQALSRE